MARSLYMALAAAITTVDRVARARRSSMSNEEFEANLKAIFVKNEDGSFKHVHDGLVSVSPISRSLHVSDKEAFPTPNSAHSKILSICREALKRGFLKEEKREGASVATRFRVVKYPEA